MTVAVETPACAACGSKGGLETFPFIGKHWVRTCRECGARQSVELPELNKTVIYVDQNGLSEMMKSFNPHTKAHQKGRVDERWMPVFEKLLGLVRSQSIVCPTSTFHEHESMVSPFNAALEEVGRVLSGGVRFESPGHIERYQVIPHVRHWLRGADAEVVDLEPQRVVHGTINCWLDLLIFELVT